MAPDLPSAAAPPRAWRALAAYALMLAGAAGLFFLLRAWGEALPPSTGEVPEAKRPAGQADVLPRVLLALAAVILLGRLLGLALRRVGQPPVIGEVVAGILLGPSLLGRLAPGAAAWLGEARPFLAVLAQLGVILYMFLVGLELNAGRLRHTAHAAVAISHASIVAPFLLGVALALGVYGELAPRGVPFTSFALFLGAALSVTAFPVLARILTDRGLDRSELGTLALGCAADDDVTAWCLLAFVVGVAQAQVGGAVLVLALSLGYLALMFGVVRPLAARLVARFDGEPPRGASAWVFVALLLAALATEAIGIHAVFGAFVLGAVIPHDSVFARSLARRLEDVGTGLLLPAFFASTGMRTELGLLSGRGWLICGGIIVLATLGKFGGTLAAARLSGLGWRASAALGALMNTRGLMGLVVLDVGLGLGALTPTLYAMMVVMALVTTLMTAPALAWAVPSSRLSVGPPVPGFGEPGASATGGERSGR
jgi:Kef-type K+ transport system membrane component KefB